MAFDALSWTADQTNFRVDSIDFTWTADNGVTRGGGEPFWPNFTPVLTRRLDGVSQFNELSSTTTKNFQF
jgi:hypothetical protein